MTGTIVSIILAALLLVFTYGKEFNPDVHVLIPILFIVPTLFILARGIIFALSLAPLQKAEQNSTPRVIELIRKDFHFKFRNALFIICVLLSFLIAIDVIYVNYLNLSVLLGVWLILTGITIDLMLYHLHRILNYLNPFAVAKMFTQAGKHSVTNDKEIELCDWIDSLSEISLKSLERSGISLCTSTIDEMREIMRLFLDASKSIAHPSHDKESKSLGITDKASYTLYFFLDRLELIFNKALEKTIEPVCSSIITALGKIIIYAAKYDLSMVSYPVHMLGKFARKAEEKKLADIGLKGSITLLEVSKIIVNEVDLTYQELKDPFFSVINQLDEIAKEAFRQDKSTNLKLLTQPFRDLKELFQSPKLANHQDTPIIINDIDRVLAEWSALELVLRTIPPIPVVPEEQTSSEPKPIPTPEQFPPPPPPLPEQG